MFIVCRMYRLHMHTLRSAVVRQWLLAFAPDVQCIKLESDAVMCDMQDYETFHEALEEDSSYASSLAKSLSLVLDEFYQNLRTVRASSTSGLRPSILPYSPHAENLASASPGARHVRTLAAERMLILPCLCIWQ